MKILSMRMAESRYSERVTCFHSKILHALSSSIPSGELAAHNRRAWAIFSPPFLSLSSDPGVTPAKLAGLSSPSRICSGCSPQTIRDLLDQAGDLGEVATFSTSAQPRKQVAGWLTKSRARSPSSKKPTCRFLALA